MILETVFVQQNLMFNNYILHKLSEIVWKRNKTDLRAQAGVKHTACGESNRDVERERECQHTHGDNHSHQYTNKHTMVYTYISYT